MDRDSRQQAPRVNTSFLDQARAFDRAVSSVTLIRNGNGTLRAVYIPPQTHLGVVRYVDDLVLHQPGVLSTQRGFRRRLDSRGEEERE